MEYDVNYYHYGNPTPREVELKFQMPYPCWLKLEESQLLQTFLEGLEVLQKESSRRMHQVHQERWAYPIVARAGGRTSKEVNR